jgi:hypothetical protein
VQGLRRDALVAVMERYFYHPLIWVAALWAVTFPGATISLAMLFKGKGAEQPTPEIGRSETGTAGHPAFS